MFRWNTASTALLGLHRNESVGITRDRILRIIGLTLVIALTFSYGTIVGSYRVFPFSIIKTSVQYISQLWNSQETSSIHSDDHLLGDRNFSETNFFEKNFVANIDYVYDTTLNNFEVYRYNYRNVQKHERLAYLGFSSGLLEVYSQQDYSVLEGTEVSLQDFEEGLIKFGGVKNLFYYNDDLIALVGLASRENECAYASLVNISLNQMLIEFPCLPQFQQTNLLGLGGGAVARPDSGILLLALGTPENSGAEIRALAQDPVSPYGKILEIPETTILGKGSDYSIYSMGHRNPQSILDTGDEIIAVEHGPRGGDEINVIRRGSNYGWPLVSLGTHYDLTYIDKTDLDNNGSNVNLLDPLFSFVPSIAISSINRCPDVYEKYYRPNRCIMIGSLRARSLFLVQISENLERVLAIEQYDVGSRVRKIVVQNDRVILGTDYEGLQTDHDFAGVIFLKFVPYR